MHIFILSFEFCAQIIWNSSTRAELLKFVDQQRAAQGPDGSYDIKDSHDFIYEALSKELFIGNVYLRVYNDQPDSEISEPEAFCVALIDFISCLLHNQCVEEPNHNVEETINFTETSEHLNEVVDGSVNEHQILNNPGTVSDEQSVGKEEPELIKNLRSALISLQVDSQVPYFILKSFYSARLTNFIYFLQNLLTSNPNLASIFSNKDKLLPLFECFSVAEASDSNIPQLCLAVLSLLTAHAPCLQAMVADGSSLLLLLQMLHSAPSCREGSLHVLYALATTPELAWAAAKHGGVVYILELLLPLTGRKLVFLYWSHLFVSFLESICRFINIVN